MRLEQEDMEVSFNKYCLVDSPTTVLPAPWLHSKVSDRKPLGKPVCGNHIPIVDDNFIEIKLTAVCGDVRSCRISWEGDKTLKKGSVYQSLRQATLPQKTEAVVGREKIDFSGGTQSALAIIDTLCSSDEDSALVKQKTPSAMPLSEPNTNSQTNLYSGDPMTPSESVASTSNFTETCLDRDANLNKSLSLLFTLSRSPAKSESDGSRSSSPKSRFSPVRKMLGPFVKSKSHRSPLSSSTESDCATGNGLSDIHLNETMPTHLLNNIPCHKQYSHRHEGMVNRNLVLQNSGAYLHGLLKFQNKHGAPFFEFSVKSTEDSYIVKTWKVENAVAWVYTFHSLDCRRKTNAGGWGFKDSYRESSTVGQMHVSCRICSGFDGDGKLNDSLVTEFVLYDIMHLQKRTLSQDNASYSPDVRKDPPDFNETLSWGNSHFEPSNSQPLAAAELRPELEIGAVIMQLPLERRGTVKMKGGGKTIDGAPHSLTEQQKAMDGDCVTSHPPKMHVLIPTGNHTSPTTQSHGPLSLLDRWRFGGGCDCGGWDMACPLVVFSNQNVTTDGSQPLIDGCDLAELFIQGRKENTPAFAMRAIEDGQYAVDFHAQLSTLQAFFICISILHSTETSTALANDRTSLSDSQRQFAKDKIRNATHIATSEKVISKVNKKVEEVLPSLVLNPPFSPVARV